MHTRSSFEAKVFAAFTAAACVVSALCLATWKLADDATEAMRLVSHTHEVISNLARIRGDSLQVELSTQNFRITGEPTHIVERDMTMEMREAALGQLKLLTADNDLQQQRWAQLREVINQRMAISRHVEILRKTEGQQAANAYVASAPLRETRARSYQLIHAMEREEARLLAIRNGTQQHSHQVLIAAGAALALALLGLLSSTFVLIRRQLRDTEVSQHALAVSEQSLATTLHSIGDAVLATDVHGRITRMNPVAERLTGWPLSQARGRPVEEVFNIIHEQTREPAQAPVAQVLQTGEAQELANHTALIARDGSECPIADSAAPIRDSNGAVVGVVLVFRDETQARHAQYAIRDHNIELTQHVVERTAQLRESEGHLRSVIDNVPALIAFIDAQQRYVYVNPQYQQRYAPGRLDIVGCTVRDVLGEERYAINAARIAAILRGEPQSFDWQPFPGSWLSMSCVPKRNAHNEVVGYYVLGSDITERKLAEEKITALYAELKQRVRQLEDASRALRTLSAGNRTMLRATDEQELLDAMCHAIVDSGGYPLAVVWYVQPEGADTLVPVAVSGHPGGLADLRAQIAGQLANGIGCGLVDCAFRTGKTSLPRHISLQRYSPDWPAMLFGNDQGVACPLRVEDQVIGVLAIYGADARPFAADEIKLLTESADDLAFGITTLRARTERQRVELAMLRLTHYDALTGLPNAALFGELLVSQIATSNRRDQPFAVLQANIERLSEINDALGFDHGDQLLREFGTRLSDAVPVAAQIARLRGDEFAILLPNSGATSALEMVQRLDNVLAKPFPVADIALAVSARIGVSMYPEHGSTPHDLFRHMDIAVQQAKKKGVRHIIFDPSMQQNPTHRLSMAGELQRAIEDGDLLLYVQPKIEIATRRVCGAEGLVRWKHAKRGLVPPGEFIDLAEHTGLIKPLTEWVIETGVRLIQDCVQQGHALPIAVNLSARNLRDESLLDKIRRWQSHWGAAAGLLEMEITESAVMEDAELALRVLHGLREESITLYIDDFGTGYSSLSYLQKMPVSYIKIDQSFIRGMLTNNDTAVIVRSTIDLAHDLGHKAVAEGVETQEQWDRLAAFGCDIVQGYLIARPMPAEDFLPWLGEFEAKSLS